MSGIFQNIDPTPPSPPGECVPPAFGAGEDTLAGWRGGWGSIFWKTPDTALYSTYVSTLWYQLLHCKTDQRKEWGNLPCVLCSPELPAGTRPTSSCSAEQNRENQLGARQCCGSGSGFGSTGSTCFWASRIRIRIH
jgi:hypothetical protein